MTTEQIRQLLEALSTARKYMNWYVTENGTEQAKRDLAKVTAVLDCASQGQFFKGLTQ